MKQVAHFQMLSKVTNFAMLPNKPALKSYILLL